MDNYLKLYRKHLIDQQFVKSTIRDYETSVRRFIIFTGKDVATITEKDIKDYVYFLITEKKLASASVRYNYFCIKRFFSEVLNNPSIFNSIPLVPETKKMPLVFSYEKIIQLVKAVPNLYEKLIILLIYTGGLFLRECLNLKIHDFDIINMRIYVAGSAKRQSRYTLLSHRLLELLNKYKKNCKPDYWLFPGKYPNTHRSLKACNSFLKKAKKIVGIHSRAGFKSIRQSCISDFIDSGANPVWLKKILGLNSYKGLYVYMKDLGSNNFPLKSPLDLPDAPDMIIDLQRGAYEISD